jgi:RNA polymerase sigma-70 factor (ECF subfamily)
MMCAMANDDRSSIQTRPSLLNRLKQGDDNDSWQEFYRVYGKLVRNFAIRAGLTDTEADEAVQETAIAMSRHLPGYQYDPKVCRFKTWLLNQASWRIKDQIKKRKKEPAWQGAAGATQAKAAPRDDTTQTSISLQVPDLTAPITDKTFDDEWYKALFSLAVARVKQQFSLRQFQIFELVVLREWPVAEVARSLAVSLANIYVTRHRISAAVKKETLRLEKRFEQAAKLRQEDWE